MSKADVLNEAIKGERGEDQKLIATVGLDILITLLQKNTDYGSTVFKEPFLGGNAGDAIKVRMSDKIARLKQLVTSGRAETAESIEDTLKDLCGYSILWVVNNQRPRLTKAEIQHLAGQQNVRNQ